MVSASTQSKDMPLASATVAPCPTPSHVPALVSSVLSPSSLVLNSVAVQEEQHQLLTLVFMVLLTLSSTSVKDDLFVISGLVLLDVNHKMLLSRREEVTRTSRLLTLVADLDILLCGLRTLVIMFLIQEITLDTGLPERLGLSSLRTLE